VNISKVLIENKQIFQSFTDVYIFGSVIKNNSIPNDIDLLLVYDKYSTEIQSEKDYIYFFLEKILDLSVDLTTLSQEELLETKFLEKIGNYERLK
jgi:uncharacterized protein